MNNQTWVLDYTMRYGAPLRELLVGKLTAFYNKVLLKYPARLLVSMPNHMKVSQADRHKLTFDEVAIVKFNPADEYVWSAHRMMSFLYYASSFSIDNKHLYIDYGKVFKSVTLPEPKQPTYPVFVAGRYQSNNLSTIVQKFQLVETDFPLYHFGCFYLNDDLKPNIQKLIRSVVSHSTEYIDEDTCYILLSYILHTLNSENPIEIGVLNELFEFNIIPDDISQSAMLDDFYILV